MSKPHNTLNLDTGKYAARWDKGPRKLHVEMSGDFTDREELIAVLREVADGLEGKPVDPDMQAANCPFAFLAETIE
jgi:hypothetical protein